MTTSAPSDQDGQASGRGHQAALASELRRLHHDPGLLVLVNAWDAASARTIAAHPSCRAIATASAAIAATHGYEDGEHIPLDLHLAAIARICAVTGLPVTADLERGYGDVRATVTGALHAGAVGVNLEDALCPLGEMIDRIGDGVTAGCDLGIPVFVNARTDVFLRGVPGALDEALRRGSAFLEAGADCVFVPGCTSETDIGRLAEALGPGRLGLLAVPGTPAPARLQALGVARLSHGPFPHRHTEAALAAYAASALGTAHEPADGSHV